jgi:pyruvate/2-oxoglutarate dehydrogenase complex dihydrolipoamide acyltransferase (E2) component
LLNFQFIADFNKLKESGHLKEYLTENNHLTHLTEHMATSAKTLATIIESLAKKYKFDEDKAIKYLATQELLPKKMLPKDDKSANDYLYASKKAQTLAEQYDIECTPGEGKGKDGKWTLADVTKAMEKPTKEKLLISPNALNLANENKLSLVGRKGSGTNGRILLKDVQAWLSNDDDKDDLNISPRALQQAYEDGVSDDELANIHGSGKDGRILLEDIVKYTSSSDKDKNEDDDLSDIED